MESSNESWIQATCDWLRMVSSDAQAESVGHCIANASTDELEILTEVLVANFDDLSHSPQRFRILMQAVAARALSLLQHSAESSAGESEAPLDSAPIRSEALAKLYELLTELDGYASAHALQILAAQGDDESIDTLAEILAEAPPEDWKQVAVGLSPLWNTDREQLEAFFRRLDDGYLHPSSMSILLDLAGYAVRKGKLSQHPWLGRHQELSSLLNSVAHRLSTLEREPTKFGSDVAEIQRILGDSVALTSSLCDALGLVGQADCQTSLEQAMRLSHRRIQVEAAGALARLGSSIGKEHLIALARDPVARLRAVHYADELGFAEEIDEDWRLPVALAESQFASWLASPDQFGLPPDHLELVDSRTMFWPSYDEPQDCYLFRYEYQLPGGLASNLGIAGPATQAFNADLSVLPLDDVYAAFAGWQAEHEDIFEIPMSLLNSSQRREADRLMGTLEDHQLECQEAQALTFFLGEVALLAKVHRDGNLMSAITDGLELLTFPLTDSPASLTPEILLAVYRGRKLLRTFNV